MAHPPAIGDLIDKKQPVTAQLVSLKAGANRSDACALIDNPHPHPAWPEAQVDAQRLPGIVAYLAHRVGHQLGHEQKDVLTDRGGKGAVPRDHRSPGRGRGLAPAVQRERKALRRS